MKWSWQSPGRFPVTADGRSATERRCCCQGGCPSSLSPSPLRRPSLPPSLCYYKAIYTRDSRTSHQGLFLSHRCEDPHQLTRTEPIRSKQTDMGRFTVTNIQSNIITIHNISRITHQTILKSHLHWKCIVFIETTISLVFAGYIQCARCSSSHGDQLRQFKRNQGTNIDLHISSFQSFTWGHSRLSRFTIIPISKIHLDQSTVCFFFFLSRSVTKYISLSHPHNATRKRVCEM